MNNTTIEIKKGNCQFNAESAKKFRSTLAKWHNASFEIADELLQKNDRVKALRTLVKSNDTLIEKLNKGESIIGSKTVAELQTEIDGWNEQIATENAQMAEYRKAQSARFKEAEDLVSKSIYEAYCGESEVSYTDAIATFLSNNGIEPCKGTIGLLILAIGKKSASARQMCKSGKHNTTFSFQQWRKIFLGELCDIMGDCLPLYKFTYVLVDKRKKATN